MSVQWGFSKYDAGHYWEVLRDLAIIAEWDGSTEGIGDYATLVPKVWQLTFKPPIIPMPLPVSRLNDLMNNLNFQVPVMII